MNFFKKIVNKVKKSISLFRPFYSVSHQIDTIDNWYDVKNIQSYRDSLYLFIGVSLIRETVASLPFDFFEIKNDDGEVEEIVDDPFLDLLQNPNNKQTKREFMQLSVAYYLLSGEAFWYLERDSEFEVPNAMANMRPDFVEILLSSNNSEVKGYKFWKSDGTTVDLLPHEVLHIKNIDPINPVRGIGVVRPARKRIVTEKEASEYQESIFKNYGRPDIAVFTNQDLNEETAKKARDKWDKVYGSNTGSKAGFFGEDVKDLKVLSVNPKEMDFIKSQKFLRDDILAALRIPKAMITSEDVNRANAKTARINYIKEACLPVRDAFDDAINNNLLARIPEMMDKFVSYESPVNEDREIMRKEAVELKKAGIITVNEARSIMEYPEVEGEDELREQSPALQLSAKDYRNKSALAKYKEAQRFSREAKKHLKKRSVLRKKFESIDSLTKLFEMTSPSRERNSIFNSQEMKNKYVKVFNEKIDDRAKDFKNNIDVYNEELQERIIENLNKFGVDPNNMFDFQTEFNNAQDIFVPLMKNMFKKEGQRTLDEVANGFSERQSEQFFTAQEIIQQLEMRAEFFITSMLDTDFNELKEIIEEGMKEGEGVDKIGRRIRDYFDNMSVNRANTIARTETGRLMNKATLEAFSQSEFVTGKMWISARDDNVRPAHQENDGEIRATGDPYPNGETFPGEFTINCRCALAPTI